MGLHLRTYHCIDLGYAGSSEGRALPSQFVLHLHRRHVHHRISHFDLLADSHVYLRDCPWHRSLHLSALMFRFAFLALLQAVRLEDEVESVACAIEERDCGVFYEILLLADLAIDDDVELPIAHRLILIGMRLTIKSSNSFIATELLDLNFEGVHSFDGSLLDGESV